MSLAEKIYDCRRKQGLSQEALAEHLGVSRQAISKWERGEAEPELAKLRLLAKCFSVSSDWLLLNEPETPPQAAAPFWQRGSAGECTSQWQQGSGTGGSDTGAGSQAAPPPQSDWTTPLPGLFNRFSWVFGVYIALLGVPFCIIGLIIMLGSASFAKTSDKMVNDFFPSPGVTIESDRKLSRAEEQDILNALGPEFSGGGMSSFTPGNALGSTVKTTGGSIGGVLLGFGLLLIAGGSILAFTLKQRQTAPASCAEEPQRAPEEEA